MKHIAVLRIIKANESLGQKYHLAKNIISTKARQSIQGSSALIYSQTENGLGKTARILWI